MATTTSGKTGRQLLTELKPGQHLVLRDPNDLVRLITQLTRVGEVYYILGPGFSWAFGNEFDLNEYFTVAVSNGETAESAIALLNNFITGNRLPAEAQVHTCHGLPAAQETAARLFGWV